MIKNLISAMELCLVVITFNEIYIYTHFFIYFYFEKKKANF